MRGGDAATARHRPIEKKPDFIENGGTGAADICLPKVSSCAHRGLNARAACGLPDCDLLASFCRSSRVWGDPFLQGGPMSLWRGSVDGAPQKGDLGGVA